MKNKVICLFLGIVLLLIYASPSSMANEVEDNSNSKTFILETTTQPVPEPSESPQPVPEPSESPQPVLEVTPSPSLVMSPEEAAGWAVIDENGNTENIIVCNIKACGSGWHGGKRVVLQTLQEDNGNVAGYRDSQFIFDENKWIYSDKSNGAKYEIPLDKPNFDNLICFENCPPPPCEKDPSYAERQDCSHFVDGTSPIPMSSLASFDLIQHNSNLIITERSKYFIANSQRANIKNINIIFNKKVNTIQIIGKKWENNRITKKIWKIKTSDEILSYIFNVPEKYREWKFIIKNKNIKKVFIT